MLVEQTPEDAFSMCTRVRSYEVARNGQVRVSNILRLMEYLATEASDAASFSHAWYVQTGTAWVVRDMHLLLGAPATIGDELHMTTWLSENRKVQAYREYSIAHRTSGALVARARARWAYVDIASGRPLRIPDDMLNRFSICPLTMRLRHLPTSQTQMATHAEVIAAREYETDSQLHINNAVYLDWLQESLHNSGTTATEFRPRYYVIEYLRPVFAGDTVHITTQLVRRGSRSTYALQEITSANATAVHIRSTSLHIRSHQ